MSHDQDLVREIGEEVESQRMILVDLCGRLVAAESVNPPSDTKAMANAVLEFLAGQGVPAERLSADDVAPNVVSTIEADKPGAHVVFNAHMDTMLPGPISSWSVPTLEMTKRDGRLYGLGMGNMKGGLAAMMLAMRVVQRRLPKLSGKLSLTAVSDEVMFGTRGTPFVLSQRPDLCGDFMICAEGPGSMGFAVAEKGLLWVDVVATGSVGHSSRALRGETAVARLARFLSRLDEFNDTYAALPPELKGVDGGDDNLGLRLSASVGVIEAGQVRSLIAGTAGAKVDLRLPPGISVADLKKRIEALAAECGGIEVRYAKGWGASWAALDNPLVVELGRAAEQIRGVPTRYVVRLPGSDARYWRDRGVPSICYGPQPTLSSGVDDYAREQDVLDCAKIFALTAMKLMSTQPPRRGSAS